MGVTYITYLISICALFMCVNGQIPLFGSCPSHDPMVNFNYNKFLGKWYETERYFALTEVASKCIAANYEKRPDGKIYVNNEVTSSITNVQRIISGVVKLVGKSGNGKLNVRYTSFPGNYETTLNVLDTDYKSYAIMWACSSITGPLPLGHTESVWLMTRKRNPTGPELQRAYGALDRYKISRTYFIKTNQKDCDTLPPAQEAIDTETTVEQNVDNSEIDGEQQEEVGQQQQQPQGDTANVSNQNSVVQIVEQSDSEYYDDYGKSATIKKSAEIVETTDEVAVTDAFINRKKLIHESQIPVEIKSFKK